MASTNTQWWKRLRCDCFTDDIVRDDHEEFTELLIPNKNDVSHVTESTAGESDWGDEDDIILVHDDHTTYETLPQQQQAEKSFLMGMLAPTNIPSMPSGTRAGVMDLVDMAKAKFMSSSEINYPPSQTGSSLVDFSKTVEMPSATSWANIAAKLRARRNKATTTSTTWNPPRPTRPPPSTAASAGKNIPQQPHPTNGPYLLGIAFPHPAYMMDRKEVVATTPPHKPRYFKTSSNVHHPQNEHHHVRIASSSSKEEDDNKIVVRL